MTTLTILTGGRNIELLRSNELVLSLKNFLIKEFLNFISLKIGKECGLVGIRTQAWDLIDASQSQIVNIDNVQDWQPPSKTRSCKKSDQEVFA